MQHTSELYKTLIAKPNHWFEPSVTIGEPGVLINEKAFRILFGGDAILIATDGPSDGFRVGQLISVEVQNGMFKDEIPQVGSAVAGRVHIEMIAPLSEIPPKAMIRLYVRVTDGISYSEWLPQGVFYTSYRYKSKNDDGVDTLNLTGYDALMLTDVTYPSTSDISYPATDDVIVNKIAEFIGVGVDPRTASVMNKHYQYPLPVGYSCREVLQMIAASYAGNWIITEAGELRLIQINDIPKETRYLTDHVGYVLVIGGDKILV